MGKLFISHASHDHVLVEAVVNLLEGAVGVPHDDIFCSSLKGQSILPGKNFIASIHEHLDKAACVLALISEAFYASAFCMCELGAVWMQSKEFLPVLIPPVDYNDLKGVLGSLQVSKIDKEKDLDELRDELVKRLNIKRPHATPRWNSRRETFLAAVPSLIKPFKGAVPREVHDKLAKEFEVYREEYGKREQEIDDLRAMVNDLKQAKDAKAVAQIVRKHLPAADQFNELVRAAAAALRPLPAAVYEALYYRVREEEYRPKEDSWDDVRTAEENGQLIASEDGTVTIDDRDSDVQRAVKALDKLERWLASAPEEFDDWYRDANKGERAELRLRKFWHRHFH